MSHLKKSYGEVHAVKDVSFSVQSGQLFAFLGPNGAGKSTTIDILCTLLKMDAGNVEIAGYDLQSQENLVRKKIGIVFQDSIMDKVLTVKENLIVRAGFYYKTKSEKLEAVNRAAKQTDIESFWNRKYGKLSGGQRRRADIARALLNTPEILFLDEPTTGLDPQTRKYVWETILNLKKTKGMTIFLTTHYMEEATDADFVTIIDDGKVVADGTPYDLKETYASDQLRLKAKEQTILCEKLTSLKISYQINSPFICIHLKNTIEAIPILKEVENLLESFEVVHGTMDDVFLNITGKEIRTV